MTWLSNVLASGTTSVFAIDDPVETVFTTLVNSVSAVDAWQAGTLLSLEAQALKSLQNFLALQPFPLVPSYFDVVTQAYFDTRVASVAAAASGISTLPVAVNPIQAATLLAQGSPAVPDPGYVEWCMTFQGETPPVGAELPAAAATAAQSWLNITNAVAVLQGSALTQIYDTAARQYRCSTVVANTIANLKSGGFGWTPIFATGEPWQTDGAGNIILDGSGNPIPTSGNTIRPLPWNWAVALPTILLDASSLASNPALLVNQQCAAIRYALVQQILSLAKLLLALRIHNIVQPTTATLRNGESLADLAARTSGNFENWPALAALNRIGPPYPGPTNRAVALSGRQLFTSNGVATPGVEPDPNDSGATYASNVLGVDWDWGPINGPSPTWTGDIVTINGYANLARSIGRRLQTPLGSLIYHSAYGSRIPPEVGSVQSADEAARLREYGNSAVRADPRTGSILLSEATTQPGSLATYRVVISPIGPGAIPVEVNATIGATP